MTTAAPLILTLALDPDSQQFFNEQRRRHFPPERNYLAAHLTLFHALPGAEQAVIEAELAALAATQPPLPLHVSAVRFMGRGVMYSLDCPPLVALHRRLQQQWQPWLSPQDRQGLHPHLTVQNKVAPDVARALHAELAATFVPFAATGTGLALWAYRGGPWELLREFALAGG